MNAAVFALAGPGIMKLVAFNLIVYAGLVVSAYVALKRGWGRLSAWSGCAFFISVFSFLQLTSVGNYNYATPYSHEAVHGLLACLGLVLVLGRWRQTGSVALAASAGLLVGVTAVLKVECLVAACALTALTSVLNWRDGRGLGLCTVVAYLSASVMPVLAFTLLFAGHMPWMDAFRTAGQAVFNALQHSRFVAEKVQLTFSGFDEPLKHLGQHAFATALAALLVAVILAGSWLAGRELELVEGWRWLGWAAAATMIGAAAEVGWLAGASEPGFALLGLALAVAGIAGWNWEKSRRRGATYATAEARLLLAAVGVLMMLRMLLFGRVYHYGFYQAAVAGMVVTASLVGDWPRVVSSRQGRRIAMVSALALVSALAARLVFRSADTLSLRTLAVGRGTDRMIHYPANREGMGELTRVAADFAERSVAPDEKLLVLPEGIMVNYLARRFTPLATTHFFAGALSGGREAELVKALAQAPPAWVLVVSRDLREYGVERYGESPGHGELLLSWVLANYTLVGSLGGDPLDVSQRGVRCYRLAAHSSIPAVHATYSH